MTDNVGGSRLTSLRKLLLWWIVGSAIVLVLVYTQLLGRYLIYGAKLLTRAELEYHATEYTRAYVTDPQAVLPTGSNLRGYRSRDELPLILQNLFADDSARRDDFQRHGDLELVVDDDLEGGDPILLAEFEGFCDRQPCEVIFFYSHRLPDGEWLYLAQGLVVTEQLKEQKGVIDRVAVMVAVTVFISLSGLAMLLIRKINRPVQQLADWADALTPDHVQSQTPDFKYQELNRVAEHLRESFKRLSLSLEKEQRFLQQASHELRTPIAVASGNIELLQKLSQQRSLSGTERDAMERLQHAVSDMQQLTETLLWLNRDNESPPPEESVNLNKLINELIDQNRYLLELKSVSVSVSGDVTSVNVPRVLCRILFSNLIRNAFQYTYSGRVKIAITGDSAKIFNSELGNSSQGPMLVEQDYGFGLGLQLVDQVATRLGWHFTSTPHEQGRVSEIHFLTKKS
ncbi:MAG: HAMP domain-containing sensor histidine kinase [Candidatus Thiodiazotropha sp.]